jgi:hypothetical protein
VTVEKQNMDPEDARREMLKETFTVSELLETVEVVGSKLVSEVLRELLSHDRGWTLAQIELLIGPPDPSLFAI